MENKYIYPEVDTHIRRDVDQEVESMGNLPRMLIEFSSHVRIKRDNRYFLVLVVNRCIVPREHYAEAAVQALGNFHIEAYKVMHLYIVDETARRSYDGSSLNPLDTNQEPEEDRLRKAL